MRVVDGSVKTVNARVGPSEMENPGVVPGFYKHEVVSIDNSVIESLGIAKWVQTDPASEVPAGLYNVVEKDDGSIELQPVTKNLDTVIDTNDYAPSGSTIPLVGQQLTDFNNLGLTPIVGSQMTPPVSLVEVGNIDGVAIFANENGEPPYSVYVDKGSVKVEVLKPNLTAYEIDSVSSPDLTELGADRHQWWYDLTPEIDNDNNTTPGQETVANIFSGEGYAPITGTVVEGIQILQSTMDDVPTGDGKMFISHDGNIVEIQNITDLDNATKADIKAEADGSTLFPNTAPEITSSDTGTVVENADISTVIYTATANDADNDTITWSLDGSDKDFLEISSLGEVTLKASADFESDKKSYHFDVVADDGTTQVSKNVHVDVTNDPADDGPPPPQIIVISEAQATALSSEGSSPATVTEGTYNVVVDPSTGAKKLEPVVAHTDDDTGDASNALDKNYKNDGSEIILTDEQRAALETFIGDGDVTPIDGASMIEAAPTWEQHSLLTDTSGSTDIDYQVMTDGTHFAVMHTDMDGNEHAMVLTDADGNPLADITGVTWDNALIADPDGGSQPLKDLCRLLSRLQSRS